MAVFELRVLPPLRGLLRRHEDLVNEPVRFNSRVLSVRGIALGLFGYWMHTRDDAMAIFAKPDGCP